MKDVRFSGIYMLGLVNKELFDNELSDVDDSLVMYGLKPVVLPKELPDDDEVTKGRGKGNKEVPEVLRKVIAGEVIEGGSANEISEAFGISKSSISAYKNNATSTTSYHEPVKSLQEHNFIVRNKIVDLSRSKLKKAIRFIDDDKLAGCNAVQLALVAKNMSSIANENDMVSNKHEGNKQSVIIYRPRIKEEDSFEIISVTD